MGDPVQLTFGEKFLPKTKGAIVEIGSKNYGNTVSFRSLYKDNEYVGIDLEAGDGVDMVLNIQDGIGNLQKQYFDVCICCNVLEHVARPWKAAKHISSIIKPGGTLYLSVPWVQRYHPYPDDYWRMSPSGIKILFPDIIFDQPYLVTFPDQQIIPFQRGADNELCKVIEGRKFMPYFHFCVMGKKYE